MFVNLSRTSTADDLPHVDRIHPSRKDNLNLSFSPKSSSGSTLEPEDVNSTRESNPWTTPLIPYSDARPIESLQKSFQNDGFLVFHEAIDPARVTILQTRLEEVLRGKYDRGSPPDKIPRSRIDSKNGEMTGGGNTFNGSAILGLAGNLQNMSRVVQIINIHKSDKHFRELATSPELGRIVTELAGWEHGARLAQDQVWAKYVETKMSCLYQSYMM